MGGRQKACAEFVVKISGHSALHAADHNLPQTNDKHHQGVEAQTETVWKQAIRHRVPRIAFANKMDRDGASLEKVINSMRKRLGCETLQLQSPMGEWSLFRGHFDLIECEQLVWDERGGSSTGKEFIQEKCDLPPTALQHRRALLEKIADLDDTFAETFLEHECTADCLPTLNKAAKQAIRRITLAQVHPTKVTRPAIPVLCGAALRNMGIQPLLDAVVDYLPSPTDFEKIRTLPASKSGDSDNLVAFVFKIQHDSNKGPLAYVRVYRGKLRLKDAVVVTSGASSSVVVSLPSTSKKHKRKERIQGLLRAEAKSFVPFENGEAIAGDICVLVGIPSLRTGDTLGDTMEPLPGLEIPPPVFTSALELETMAHEAKFLEAMSIMTRDDPSLVFVNDPETGQMLLSGIGELHLEVSLDRLLREHGVKVYTSPPRVAYRETMTSNASDVYKYERTLSGVKNTCKLKLSLKAFYDVSGCDKNEDSDPIVTFREDIEAAAAAVAAAAATAAVANDSKSSSKKKFKPNALLPEANPEDGLLKKRIPEVIREAIESGIVAALSRGPVKGFPVRGVEICCESVDLLQPPEINPNVVRTAAASCTKELFQTCGPKLMEPVFDFEATVPEISVGDVLGDLSSRRRADILSVDPSQANPEKIVLRAKVPGAEMLSYSKFLRMTTGGQGAYSATFDRYVIVEK